MELSERKKKILQFVVDDYIETAVPVSSKSLTERHLSNLSSATIRNELSALEELGFLTQLHTSSGRVPSAEAYKLYVSDLMVKDSLTEKELEYIKKIFLEKADNMEEVIKNTAKVISELTQYTSVGVISPDAGEKIQTVKFFRFKPDTALVLDTAPVCDFLKDEIDFGAKCGGGIVLAPADMRTIYDRTLFAEAVKLCEDKNISYQHPTSASLAGGESGAIRELADTNRSSACSQ